MPQISTYTLKGNNKTINARIHMMRSNRTNILRIDLTMIPLLGFGANNKKIMCYATLISQYLSISNAVTIKEFQTHTLEDRNAGITLPHKHCC
jgi:hypothetical protein